MSSPGTGETRGIEHTGDVPTDVARLLASHNKHHTVAHSGRVAQEARRLALRFGADGTQAELAGWLHDVSVVIPAAEWVATART